MLIFWKAKLVLLAVPKTGTTALEEAFLPWADASFVHPPRLKHMPLRRYRRQIAPLLSAEDSHLEVMAIMREPVDWLSSWYRYRTRHGLRGKPQSTEAVDFETFVEAWAQDEPPEYARVGRQSRFLTDVEGGGGVDHLFRYDQFGKAIAFLQDRLDADPVLTERNVSPIGLETSLSDTALKELRSRAPEDFEMWQRLKDDRA